MRLVRHLVFLTPGLRLLVEGASRQGEGVKLFLVEEVMAVLSQVVRLFEQEVAKVFWHVEEVAELARFQDLSHWR